MEELTKTMSGANHIRVTAVAPGLVVKSGLIKLSAARQSPAPAVDGVMSTAGSLPL